MSVLSRPPPNAVQPPPESIVIEPVEGKVWTPVRVKPRCEKKLGEFCVANNVHYYLPLMRRVHRYHRRTAAFFVPMFPGYVFCTLDDDHFRRLQISSSLLFRVNLDGIQEKRLITELRDLQFYERISFQQEVVVKPEIIQGVRVRVVAGPLMGTNGVVDSRDKSVIHLNIEILGHSVSTKVDIGDLEVED